MFVGFMAWCGCGLFAFLTVLQLAAAIRPLGLVLLVGDGTTSSQ
jgi:hypothetical protein